MVRGDKNPPPRSTCCMPTFSTPSLLPFMEWKILQRTGQSYCVQGTEKEVGNSDTALNIREVEANNSIIHLPVVDVSLVANTKLEFERVRSKLK